MKIKKNDEPLKVVIDTQEIPFDSFSWSMDKTYIKEPTRNTSESFENLVPFRPTKSATFLTRRNDDEKGN